MALHRNEQTGEIEQAEYGSGKPILKVQRKPSNKISRKFSSISSLGGGNSPSRMNSGLGSPPIQSFNKTS